MYAYINYFFTHNPFSKNYFLINDDALKCLFLNKFIWLTNRAYILYDEYCMYVIWSSSAVNLLETFPLGSNYGALMHTDLAKYDPIIISLNYRFFLNFVFSVDQIMHQFTPYY